MTPARSDDLDAYAIAVEARERSAPPTCEIIDVDEFGDPITELNSLELFTKNIES